MEESRTQNQIIGAKIREFRTMFGVPRSILQDVSGLNYTSLYRIERGERGMSAATIAKIVVAMYTIMRRINVNRRLEFVAYLMDLMELVARAETGRRGR